MTTHFDISPPRPCQTYGQHDLQRLLAEDLPASEAEALRQHIQGCASCSQALAELQAERQAFFANMPFARFAADHEQRRQRSLGLANSFVERLRAIATRLQSPRGLASLAGVAAAAMLLLWIAPAFNPSSSTTRLKGAQNRYLAFLVKEADGARRGHDGEALRQGDRIQFLLRQAPGRRSMVLLGIDGRGQVSVYRHEAIREQSKGAQKLRPMDNSLILDDSIGTERFYLIFSNDADSQLLASKAKRAAQKLQRSGMDLHKARSLQFDAPDLIVDSVSIRKVARNEARP